MKFISLINNMKNYLTIDIGATSGRVILFKNNNGIFNQNEIHRFSNDLIITQKNIRWNFDLLIRNIKEGINKALQVDKNIRSIGIDTWGCDFGIIDENNELIEQPISYRDNNSKKYVEKSERIISKESLYLKTGIQFMSFNTIYQLMYATNRLKITSDHKIMMIPDLIALKLTGNKFVERTNASTTSLYNPKTNNWIDDLKELGINPDNFPNFISPGEIYGYLDIDKFDIKNNKSNINIPVVAVGSHDTASAIAAIELEDDELYISSGTWSLLGITLDKPHITKDSFKLNFTNELGINGETRFLKNIMGMWMVEKVKELYELENETLTYDEITSLCANKSVKYSFIDVDDPIFVSPKNMIKEIQSYCLNTNQNIPKTKAEKFKTIYYSMAYKYLEIIKKLEKLVDRKFTKIKIIGGGSKNKFLNQLVANITNLTVISGPVEATALGNLKVLLKNDKYKKEEVSKIIESLYEKNIYINETNFTNEYEKFEKIIRNKENSNGDF